MEAMGRQCLEKGSFIEDLKSAAVQPHTTLIENVKSWRVAADQWCAASSFSKAWAPLDQVERQLENHYPIL